MRCGAALWTARVGRRYRTDVTDSADDQPKHGRNRNWRSWTVTKNRPIRIADELWLPYEAVCKAEGTDRSKDLRAFIERRVSQYRETHPDAVLPGDDERAHRGDG